MSAMTASGARSHKPGGKMNLIGTFNSKHDAEKAMKEMKQCNMG